MCWLMGGSCELLAAMFSFVAVTVIYCGVTPSHVGVFQHRGQLRAHSAVKRRPAALIGPQRLGPPTTQTLADRDSRGEVA